MSAIRYNGKNVKPPLFFVYVITDIITELVHDEVDVDPTVGFLLLARTASGS